MERIEVYRDRAVGGKKLKLTAARRKSKLHTAISLSFLLSSDLIRWCHASSTCRMEYEMSDPGIGCCVDIVDVSSQCCGLWFAADDDDDGGEEKRKLYESS